MARITPIEVREVINTPPAATDLDPFIDLAHRLVNAQLLAHGIDEAILTDIERYLAAHFVAITYPPMVERSLPDARQTLEVPRGGRYLSGTRYGQMAILLDPTGTLARLEAPTVKRAATLTVL